MRREEERILPVAVTRGPANPSLGKSRDQAGRGRAASFGLRADPRYDSHVR
jgi:hypothetical protein